MTAGDVGKGSERGVYGSYSKAVKATKHCGVRPGKCEDDGIINRI